MPRRHPIELSRRDFLRRAGGTALAVPSLAAILAACSKPGETVSGDGSSPTRQIADPNNPVTLPLKGAPIAADTPIETGATLKVYNWDAYMYKKVLQAFEEEFDCTVEWTTFNNQEEGIQKVTSGQVTPDVFFVTTDYVSRLVEAALLQPLQHDLIPNMEANVWQSFWDPGPWYDVGWQYTIPYTIYTTAVAYRRDRIDDEVASEQGYDMLWNPEYSGAISYYDSYRDAIGMAMLRNGGTNVNSGDPAEVAAAADAILEILNDLGGRLTINGAYAKLPEGEFTVAQSWSGDIVGGQWYLPKGTPVDVLGYWYPEDHRGLIGSDTITIPTAASNPRLAHEFLNFFLDSEWGYVNFAEWNGYQPPFTAIDPDRLVSDGVVPPALASAVVTEDMFTQGYQQSELPPEVDQIWADEWARVQTGG